MIRRLSSLLLLGVALGALGAVWLDVRKGKGLMDWLRGHHRAPMPQTTGFWGEVAYRMERSLSASEGEADQAQRHLQQFLSAIEASPNGVLLVDRPRPVPPVSRERLPSTR